MKKICEWDAYNATIISEQSGKLEFEFIEEGVTFQSYTDDTTKMKEKIIIEPKDRSKVPSIHVLNDAGERLRTYNLPAGAHLLKEDGEHIEAGQILVKIPRAVAKAGDITGGLPRVTELFEARNPSNPAVVSEIDGEVMELGRVKRGNREIVIQSKTGETKKYMVPLSKQVLVQVNDFVKAGTPLSDGVITPADILAIKGPTAVQEYIVNEVQDVYRLQGVKINDKHFEVIVRQMMRKVEIVDAGDTRFLEQQVVDKNDFAEENDRIWGKKVVMDAGDSPNLKAGMIVTARKLRDENSSLKTSRHEVGGHQGCYSCHIQPDLARYHTCGFANQQLHVGRFFPGNHQGAQRGRHPRQGGQTGRLEGKCDLWSPDSCRYRSARIGQTHCRQQGRFRPSQLIQKDRFGLG